MLLQARPQADVLEVCGERIDRHRNAVCTTVPSLTSLLLAHDRADNTGI